MILSADGYIPITPEYNHTISGALKNTLDYCLEEYFFKPSAIVSYSVGSFGGINAAQHLRQIFAELGSPSIHNIWIQDGSKDLPVDRYTHRSLLKDSLDEIFAELDVYEKDFDILVTKDKEIKTLLAAIKKDADSIIEDAGVIEELLSTDLEKHTNAINGSAAMAKNMLWAAIPSSHHQSLERSRSPS